MKLGDREKAVLAIVMVFVLGLLILPYSAAGLERVQEMVTGIVKMWNSFISKDIVGIV